MAALEHYQIQSRVYNLVHSPDFVPTQEFSMVACYMKDLQIPQNW